MSCLIVHTVIYNILWFVFIISISIRNSGFFLRGLPLELVNSAIVSAPMSGLREICCNLVYDLCRPSSILSRISY